jgi:hypothetical protein
VNRAQTLVDAAMVALGRRSIGKRDFYLKFLTVAVPSGPAGTILGRTEARGRKISSAGLEAIRWT